MRVSSGVQYPDAKGMGIRDGTSEKERKRSRGGSGVQNPIEKGYRTYGGVNR